MVANTEEKPGEIPPHHLELLPTHTSKHFYTQRKPQVTNSDAAHTCMTLLRHSVFAVCHIRHASIVQSQIPLDHIAALSRSFSLVYCALQLFLSLCIPHWKSHSSLGLLQQLV